MLEGPYTELKQEQVENLCRSEGENCRYLADFSGNCVCMRQTVAETLIDQEQNEIPGDFGYITLERPVNCSGPPDFKPTEDFILEKEDEGDELDN